MIDTVQTKPSKIPPWKYAEIERKVVELYVEQSIHKLPIDPFEIIKKRGYILVPFSKLKLDFFEESIDKQNDAFSFYEKTIATYIKAFDDSKPYERLRFTLMHELGHIDLGHKGESDLARRMADYYAGYALAPSPLIHRFATDDVTIIKYVFWVSNYCAEVCRIRYSNWLTYGGIDFRDYESKLLSLFQDFENNI